MKKDQDESCNHLLRRVELDVDGRDVEPSNWRRINESLHRLFSFERPFHIVSTRLNAQAFLDEIFHLDPETHLFKRIVQPACCYTKVSVMWSHVVNTMMYAWQNEMHVLQNGYVSWQTEVSMRPLVKLVSERYEYG